MWAIPTHFLFFLVFFVFSFLPSPPKCSLCSTSSICGIGQATNCNSNERRLARSSGRQLEGPETSGPLLGEAQMLPSASRALHGFRCHLASVKPPPGTWPTWEALSGPGNAILSLLPPLNYQKWLELGRLVEQWLQMAIPLSTVIT